MLNKLRCNRLRKSKCFFLISNKKMNIFMLYKKNKLIIYRFHQTVRKFERIHHLTNSI